MAQHYQRLIKSSLQDFSVHSINLHARNVLGKGYELGHICGKYYSKDNMPTVDELAEDLQNLRGVYRELKGILSGSSVTDKKPREEKAVDIEQIEQEEKKAEKQAATLSDEELLQRALQAETKPPIQKKSKHYPRDPNVVAYVKRRAKGKCELCEEEAPFIAKDREPFLECHHIIERANSGSDSINNAVALCPNCHRKMHNLGLETDKNKLKEKIKVS